LVSAGIPVRISGQDVERGTFSHRHAVLRLEDSEENIYRYNTLAQIKLVSKFTIPVYQSMVYLVLNMATHLHLHKS